MSTKIIRFIFCIFAALTLTVGCQVKTDQESNTASHLFELEAEPAIQPVRGVHLPDATVLELQASPTCPNGICMGLGNSFYLPSINALSINTGGNIFFKNRNLGTCTQASETSQTNRNFSTASSMENFVKNTMASADLSGSDKTAALTVKGSAQFMTGSSSDVTSSFYSVTLDVNVVTHAVDFLQDPQCFSGDNINQALLAQFESLAQIKSSQVGSSASWSPYVDFLKTQGSHIMMQQQIGSRFQQWESSTSKASDIQNTLKAKACAEVEGVSTGGGWSVQGCSAYSKDEKQQALKTTSTSKTIVLGGTQKTRIGLGQKVTEASLNDFIASAEKGDQAVRFIFKPIWQLLSIIYRPACATDGKGSKACQNLQRASNLQAAYEGWTAVGCPRLVDGRKKAYQTMAIAGTSSQGINTYKCSIAKTGCRTNNDCIAGGALGSVCYCYGPGCLDTGAKISGTDLFRDKVRGSKSGSYKVGVNQSCYYNFGCSCDARWSGGLLNRTVYLQSEQ